MGCGLRSCHKELKSSNIIQNTDHSSITSFYALKLTNTSMNLKKKGLYAIIEEGASQEYSRAIIKSESLLKLQASIEKT